MAQQEIGAPSSHPERNAWWADNTPVLAEVVSMLHMEARVDEAEAVRQRFAVPRPSPPGDEVGN